MNIPTLFFTRSVLLGKVRVSDRIQKELSEAEIRFAIQRHAVGDWGTVDAKTAYYNRNALVAGRSVISAFRSKSGKKFWVITSCNRSVTSVIFPQEDRSES